MARVNEGEDEVVLLSFKVEVIENLHAQVLNTTKRGVIRRNNWGKTYAGLAMLVQQKRDGHTFSEVWKLRCPALEKEYPDLEMEFYTWMDHRLKKMRVGRIWGAMLTDDPDTLSYKIRFPLNDSHGINALQKEYHTDTVHLIHTTYDQFTKLVKAAYGLEEYSFAQHIKWSPDPLTWDIKCNESLAPDEQKTLREFKSGIRVKIPIRLILIDLIERGLFFRSGRPIRSGLVIISEHPKKKNLL